MSAKQPDQAEAPVALRTLIVDDEPLAIERMQVLCSELEGISVIGTANDGASALRLADKLAPDLLLLDMTMPGMDGLQLLHALRSNGPTRGVGFLLITGRADRDTVEPGIGEIADRRCLELRQDQGQRAGPEGVYQGARGVRYIGVVMHILRR